MTSDQIVVLKRYSLSLVGEIKQVGARRKELEGSKRKFQFVDDSERLENKFSGIRKYP